IKVMKNKLQTFSEDEALAHYAMQRQLGKWVIEGEKKLKYEEGIEKGKENERKVILNLLLKEKYSNESLLWLDECSNDQLQDVFKYVYTNISMNDLKSTILSR
ncbi:MAG: hypothetical protein RR512_06200, partial [Coprobacillus sp.]